MIRCENDVVEEGAFARAEAEVKMLDEYIGIIPEGAKVGVIKIDTEGMDYYVVQGAKKFLEHFKPPYIQSEYNPSMIKNKGY